MASKDFAFVIITDFGYFRLLSTHNPPRPFFTPHLKAAQYFRAHQQCFMDDVISVISSRGIPYEIGVVSFGGVR